jgi:hypothetical protein
MSAYRISVHHGEGCSLYYIVKLGKLSGDWEVIETHHTFDSAWDRLTEIREGRLGRCAS